MQNLVERCWFAACSSLGRLLRAGTYSTVRMVSVDGVRMVRKRRRAYAPLLVAFGRPLVRVLDTGVRVLTQRDWEQRERLLHRRLRNASIHVEPDGTIVLPALDGVTLASLLEDPTLPESDRRTAVKLAADALAAFHRAGLTHGDAMAENVMVDLAGGAAHWFDFETVHDPARAPSWRRADDVRALLSTCLLRTSAPRRQEVFDLVIDAFQDDEIVALLDAEFSVILKRPLIFHLGQAPLPLAGFREAGRMIRGRVRTPRR